MSPILSFIASRMWACDHASLDAWAAGKESAAALDRAGVAPSERISRVMSGAPAIVPEIANGVASIPIQGVLTHNGPWWTKLDGDTTDYLDIRQAIDAAAADPSVSEIALQIDSPGGDAVGLVETVAGITRAQAAGKRVVAYVSGMAASAAYFIASACDEIVAEGDALIGSIGTYTVLRDTTGMQDAIGIHLIVVSSGAVKGGGADGKITESVKAATQARVDAIAAVFFAQVSAGRDMTPEQVSTVATGEVWVASTALASGLIDRIGVPGKSIRQTVDIPSTELPSPAATLQSSEVSHMDALDLIAAHPKHAAMIATAAKASKPVAEIAADIARADAAAEIDTARAAAVAAEAATVTARAEAATEKARADKAESDLAALRALADGGKAGAKIKSDGNGGAIKLSMAEFSAMPLADREAFAAAGGIIV